MNNENYAGNPEMTNDKEYEEELREASEYLDAAVAKGDEAVDENVAEGYKALTKEQKITLMTALEIIGNLPVGDQIRLKAELCAGELDALHRYTKGYNDAGVRYVVADDAPDAMIYLLKKEEEALVEVYNSMVAQVSILGMTSKTFSGMAEMTKKCLSAAKAAAVGKSGKN